MAVDFFPARSSGDPDDQESDGSPQASNRHRAEGMPSRPDLKETAVDSDDTRIQWVTDVGER